MSFTHEKGSLDASEQEPIADPLDSESIFPSEGSSTNPAAASVAPSDPPSDSPSDIPSYAPVAHSPAPTARQSDMPSATPSCMPVLSTFQPSIASVVGPSVHVELSPVFYEYDLGNTARDDLVLPSDADYEALRESHADFYFEVFQDYYRGNPDVTVYAVLFMNGCAPRVGRFASSNEGFRDVGLEMEVYAEYDVSVILKDEPSLPSVDQFQEVFENAHFDPGLNFYILDYMRPSAPVFSGAIAVVTDSILPAVARQGASVLLVCEVPSQSPTHAPSKSFPTGSVAPTFAPSTSPTSFPTGSVAPSGAHSCAPPRDSFLGLCFVLVVILGLFK